MEVGECDADESKFKLNEKLLSTGDETTAVDSLCFLTGGVILETIFFFYISRAGWGALRQKGAERHKNGDDENFARGF